MIHYSITATVEDALIERFEEYMAKTHIPDVLASGKFVGAAMSQARPGLYRMEYIARTQSDLDSYLAQDAEALRQDYIDHFPSGTSVTREVWTDIERWDTGGSETFG